MKKNYFYVLLYQIVIVITPLISTPYVSRVLGRENIGMDAYVNSILQIFTVFTLLNVGVYGRKKIAEIDKLDLGQLKKTFSSIYLLQFLCGVFVSIVYFLFVYVVSEYQELFLIYGIMLIANIFDISWFFVGRENVDKIMMRNIVVKVINILCLFIFVKQPNDIYIYAFINGLSLLIGQVVTWKALIKEIGVPYISITASLIHIRSMLLLGVIPCVSLLYTTVNKVFLGNIMGTTEVGYYNQAFKLFTICLGFVSALSTVTMPRLTQYYVNGKMEIFVEFIKQAIHYVCLTTIPLSIGMIYISPKLVPLFLGKEFLQVIPVIRLLSICLLLVGLQEIFGMQILLITNQRTNYTLSIIIGSVLSFFINIALVKHLGSSGTAISFIAANITILVIQMYYSRHFISLKFCFKEAIRFFILSLMMITSMIFFENIFLIEKDISIVLGMQVLVGITAYIVGLLIIKEPLISKIINKSRSYI